MDWKDKFIVICILIILVVFVKNVQLLHDHAVQDIEITKLTKQCEDSERRNREKDIIICTLENY